LVPIVPIAPTVPPLVYLHIGAMKTGTSFLQHLMAANKDGLRAAGYLFPGSRWRDQDLGARDILNMARGNATIHALCEGKWDELTSEMLAFEGRASILSMEFLSFANAAKAARVVDSLAGAEVHVVLTVRDAVRVVAAQWQTHCRNGGTASWPAFTRGVRWRVRFGRLFRGESARTFVMAQGIPRMLYAWGRLVPPERFHVVTVPPPGSDPMLLWDRFAQVVGVDPAVCSQGTDHLNASLGQASADLMRRINGSLGKLPSHEYAATLKVELATRILTTRADVEAPAALDRTTRALALKWNRRVRKAIESSRAHVVGDLADLPVVPDGTTAARSQVDPSEDDLLAAAETARDGLVNLVLKRSKLVGKSGRTGHLPPVPQVDLSQLPTKRDRWRASRDPVDAAVTELSALAHIAIDLHRQAAHTKETAHPRPTSAKRFDW